MLQNKPINLKVSGKQDFVLPVCVLYFFALVAGLLSPHPLLLTILTTVVFGARWATIVIELTKANKDELTLVIFPDERVQLKFDQADTIEGFLVGQQWCTRWLAVIRFTAGGTTRKLVLSSVHQHNVNDFRRLHMWLQQGLCNSAVVNTGNISTG